jgi:hypothetical protein
VRLFFVLCLLSLPLWALPEASEVGVIYRLQDKKLGGLEQVRPLREQLQVQAPLQRNYLVIPGERSSVRFSPATVWDFTVRFRLGAEFWPWPSYAPEPSQFGLYVLQPEGGRRLLILSEQTPVRLREFPGVPLRVSAYAKDSLRLSLTQSLEPAEYAILRGQEEAFCFAVDSSYKP